MIQQKPQKKDLKARVNFPYEMGWWWPVSSIPYLCGTNVLPYEYCWHLAQFCLNNYFFFQSWKIKIQNCQQLAKADYNQLEKL